MARFARIQFVFIGWLVLATVIWETQDFVASFAARELTTETTLRTTQEKDDTRVLRAYKAAKQNVRVNNTLVTEKNPQQQTRDAVLTVTGQSDGETLEARETLVKEMRAAFAREGPGELFDMGNRPYTKPVENSTMTLVRNSWCGLAAAALLVGLVRMILQWKSSHLPKGALAGILATAFTLLLIFMGDNGAPIWVLIFLLVVPVGLLVLVSVLTARVRKAASWAEGRAKITEAKVEVVRHRFQGDTTTVKNKAAVAYDFKVGTQTIHGDRISLGFAPGDNVDETLRLYRVGKEVPVFYDPANPKDCVLERNPPVSMGCLWTGTVVFLLLYMGGVVWYNTGWSPGVMLANAMPAGVHHPMVVLGTVLFGLFCTVVGTYLSLHPRKAFPWLRTPGIIVSSEVEGFREGSSSGSSHNYYRAVIEFSYEVDGQEYHNTTENMGGFKITVSGPRSLAEEAVAAHPVGMSVEVFYDPANPTKSGLNVDTEMELNGHKSLIVAAVMFAIAWYAATH